MIYMKIEISRSFIEHLHEARGLDIQPSRKKEALDRGHHNRNVANIEAILVAKSVQSS